MRQDVADMPGASALPRKNGELVFDEPWESRAFGLAVSASDAGAYDWEEFRQGLIAEVASWEAEHGHDQGEGGDWRYYARWLATFEQLLAQKGLVSQDELVHRMGELEHEDDHDHGGGH